MMPGYLAMNRRYNAPFENTVCIADCATAQEHRDPLSEWLRCQFGPEYQLIDNPGGVWQSLWVTNYHFINRDHAVLFYMTWCTSPL